MDTASGVLEASQTSQQSEFQRNYAVRGEYQRADTTLTLREGLEEYYRVNPGLSDPAKIDHEHSATYFHRHDCTHVIFGTHTGALDEGVNDMFTLFGVQLPFWKYVTDFLKTTEAKTIAKEYAGPSLLRILLGTLRLFPKIYRTCRAMKKKWPWEPPADAFDRPLVDLRQEYGIAVWRPEEVLRLD